MRQEYQGNQKHKRVFLVGGSMTKMGGGNGVDCVQKVKR